MTSLHIALQMGVVTVVFSPCGLSIMGNEKAKDDINWKASFKKKNKQKRPFEDEDFIYIAFCQTPLSDFSTLYLPSA